MTTETIKQLADYLYNQLQVHLEWHGEQDVEDNGYDADDELDIQVRDLFVWDIVPKIFQDEDAQQQLEQALEDLVREDQVDDEN